MFIIKRFHLNKEVAPDLEVAPYRTSMRYNRARVLKGPFIRFESLFRPQLNKFYNDLGSISLPHPISKIYGIATALKTSKKRA